MNRLSLKGVKRICAIGAGDILVAALRCAREAGLDVAAVLAPRHASEHLPLAGGVLADHLAALQVDTYTVQDINDLGTWPVGRLGGAGSMALCFGSSWIFAQAVIESFEFGMINVNQIPVPRYLGGAHYTWQILHDDRSGGCFLQRITREVDRGELLMRHAFKIPSSARTPKDYFKANFTEGCRCMQEFFDRIRAGALLEAVPYDTLDADRLYFPRLRTGMQAYVDWGWSTHQIERFCNAFDEPYSGAMSFLRGERVHLRDVRTAKVGSLSHPFTAGLVVRRSRDEAIVATRDGALQIGVFEDDAGNDIRRLLKEGARLVTVRSILDEALAFVPKLTSKGFA